MTTIVVRGDKLTVSANLAKDIKEKAWEAVRQASFGTESRIKKEMPKRTGRAAASWGRWTAGASAGGPADSVWEEDKDNLRITQGSNVEYVPALNAGHSQQAPAGFIDAAGEVGQRALDDLIDDLFAQVKL
jgi:hypothetical protein